MKLAEAISAGSPHSPPQTDAMIFNFEHGSLPGSLELAYLGDSLYDLYVREHLVAKGGKVRAMHREAISLVCAHAQAQALSRVAEALIGWLYVTGQRERMNEILGLALPENDF